MYDLFNLLMNFSLASDKMGIDYDWWVIVANTALPEVSEVKIVDLIVSYQNSV